MLLAALVFAFSVAWAQENPSQTPSSSDQGTSTPGNDQGTSSPDNDQGTSTPAPAFGQDNSSAQLTNENPPISSLDQPSLEAPFAGRSFLVPSVQVSQSIDSNAGNAIGGSRLTGVTRGLGSVALQKLWSRFDLSLGYVGGGAYYTGRGTNFNQVHNLDAQQRYLWRTGQFSLRDTFSYLPEGSFGYESYGGAGNYLGLGGLGGAGGGSLGGGLGGTQFNFFGPGQFASLGQQPRITNVVIADVVQQLSPRSSVTAAGSYGLVHFTDNALGFINSRQVSAQAGYNYQVSRKDQLGVVYGHQDFRYPNAAFSNFSTDLFNALYGHRISGRLDLVLGGGPQITHINNPLFGSFTRVSFSGRGELRYRFPKTFVSLLYNRYNTTGSGLFTGATSDVARVTVSRPVRRVWNTIADVGYSRNSRIAPSTVGVNAQTYAYWYAGGSVNRSLGRDFSMFISYQYNRLGFDQSFCTPSANSSCTRTSQRNEASVGLTWHPHPIRLD